MINGHSSISFHLSDGMNFKLSLFYTPTKTIEGVINHLLELVFHSVQEQNRRFHVYVPTSYRRKNQSACAARGCPSSLGADDYGKTCLFWFCFFTAEYAKVGNILITT